MPVPEREKFPSSPLPLQIVRIVQSSATQVRAAGRVAEPAKGVTMNLHRNERGQMLVMTAIELVMLIGFLAIATDVGVLFHSKRKMQIAVDAAATAGAMNELYDVSTGSLLTSHTVYAACLAVANNGYGSTSDCSATMSSPFTTSDNATVTVNTPPLSGYHGSTGYVEAIIAKPNPLYFFKAFTGNSTTTVAVRAVAGSPGASKTCAFLMDPTGVDMQMQGAATIKSPGCSWYVNSNGSNTDGVTTSQTGGAATLDAPYVASVGTAGASTFGGTPVYSGVKPDTPPAVQQVGAVPPSDCSAGETYAGTSASASGNTTGSTFPTSIDGGGGVVCFTGTNADISGTTLSNGVFVFENGVVAGNPTGTTNLTNATLEVYGGSFTQNSNSTLNISSPCSDLSSYAACQADTFGNSPTNQLSYDGVALLVPAANTTYDNTDCQKIQHGTLKNKGALTVQIGSSGQSFDGYIVAPSAAVFLNDNGGSVAVTGLVSACLFNKSSTLNLTNYNTAHPNTSPLRYVALVE